MVTVNRQPQCDVYSYVGHVKFSLFRAAHRSELARSQAIHDPGRFTFILICILFDIVEFLPKPVTCARHGAAKHDASNNGVCMRPGRGLGPSVGSICVQHSTLQQALTNGRICAINALAAAFGNIWCTREVRHWRWMRCSTLPPALLIFARQRSRGVSPDFNAFCFSIGSHRGTANVTGSQHSFISAGGPHRPPHKIAR